MKSALAGLRSDLRSAGDPSDTMRGEIFGASAATMPRTMLGCSIGRFSPAGKKYYLGLKADQKTVHKWMFH
jgi:hypothetical protein